MSILICGSIAYDNIMVFQGRFKEHILPEQIHILNVAFLVPQLRREFGGCAGNIGYNLKMLGGEPLIMATVGSDAAPYVSRLDTLGITRQCVREVPEELTAQAFITTDLDNNQIIAFHPGAMNFSHENRIDGSLGAKLAIIAPDGKDGMLQHARECAAAGIPFVFDPGQGLPMFSGPELAEFVRLADYVAVNDYEGKMLEDKTGMNLETMARGVKALVLTLGSQGSVIFANGQRHEIPVVKAEAILDPTGCGDAYRAGLLYGIAKGWDWPSTGRLGALMGSIKIEQRGAQNHRPGRQEIVDRFKREFSYSPW